MNREGSFKRDAKRLKMNFCGSLCGLLEYYILQKKSLHITNANHMIPLLVSCLPLNLGSNSCGCLIRVNQCMNERIRDYQL